MMTSGEASLMQSNVNSFIALLFVGTVAFAAGLLIWHVATGINPIEKAIASQLYDLQ